MKPARGQALVLAVFLLLLGVSAWLRLYDAGQLVHDKSRLTQAVDAAAYSGALVQARALNLQAHINRAHIAHQVAMAHLVTLGSAAQFVNSQAKRAGMGNPPAGVIAMMFGADHAQAYLSTLSGQTATTGALNELAQAYARHDALVNDVLWQAQVAIVQSLPAARTAAMREVLQANHQLGHAPGGTEVMLDEVPLSDSLPGHIRLMQGAARSGMRQMVLAANAKYGFLDPRNHTARNSWVVSWRCPSWRHELRRRGGTQWQGYDAWLSTDTQSYHALRSNKYIGCYYREYPMGWGNVGSGKATVVGPHVADPPENFSAQDFWRWVQEHTDWDIFQGMENPLALSYAVVGAARWPGRGLPGYVDLDPARADAPVRFAIRAMRPLSSVPSLDQASRVRAGGAWLGAQTRLPGDVLAAASAAEAYFVRPQPRADRRVELAHLFHPYWQARLVPVTAAEREQARQRQGGV